MKYKSMFIIYASVVGILIIAGFIYASTINKNNSDSKCQSKQTKWAAPASADKLKNPLTKNRKEAKAGKALYDDNCALCHGDKGKGDGPAGVELDPKPHDLTSAEIQKQSDGAIFWKISNGNPPMDAWKNSLSNKQRWELVNYIRELKKK